MKSYTYEVTNILNGKKYIGATKANHFKPNYYGSGPKIMRAVEKYGRDKFEIRVLKEFETPEGAFEYERQLVEELGANSSPDYYNCYPGGACSMLSRIMIHRGNEERKFVVEDELNSYLSEGWELGLSDRWFADSRSHGGLGTIWMNNGRYNARVRQEEIERFKYNGFIEGLLIHTKGRIRITNDDHDNHLIDPRDLPKWEEMGYYKGYHRSAEGKKGRRGIHRGNENRFVKKDEVDKYLSEGWELGFCDSKAYYHNKAPK